MGRNVVDAITRYAKVFISRSQNIFENLAFEEWLLRNSKPDEQGESMLLWRYACFFVLEALLVELS